MCKKSKAPNTVPLLESAEPIYDHEEKIIHKLAIKKAFEMLKVEEKELLLLKGNGLSSTEMCTILNMPRSTARSRLVVAGDNLQKLLKEGGVEYDE